MDAGRLAWTDQRQRAVRGAGLAGTRSSPWSTSSARQGSRPSRSTSNWSRTVSTTNSAEALSVLAKLRLAGFGLALDDVGKRNSGLLQLANLPVTEIKIDIEIIRQARSWEKARSIFAFLAELGHRLGTEVVAEGVELQSDLDFIRKHPVDFIQGHLIRKKSPLPDLMAALPTLAGSVDACPAQPAAA